jgi:single-stranded DNA-binding protein
MTTRPQDTSAEEPDGGNPHIRFRGGPRQGDRPGLLNNSFRLTAVGHLARNPELNIQETGTFARFCLVGHDDKSKDGQDGPDHETVTSLWFFASGNIATEIGRDARKGDQLFLEARVIANNWTERGERHHGHAFMVTGFRFGAKRGDPGVSAANRRRAPSGPPPPLPAQAEVASPPMADA